MKKKTKLFMLATSALLLAGCSSTTNTKGSTSPVQNSQNSVESTKPQENSKPNDSTNSDKKADDSTKKEDENQSVVYKASLKKTLTVNFYNSNYQGAGDTFVVENIEELATGNFTAIADNTETLVELTGSWLKLTLVKNGSYTLSDTAGYNMTESGTWTLKNYKLSINLPTKEGEDKIVKTVILKDSINVTFANKAYQGAGDTFIIDWTEDFNTGSYTKVDNDTTSLATFNGSWMNLDLKKDGTYSISDTAGYNMTESGTWTYKNYMLTVTQPGEGGLSFKASSKPYIYVAFLNKNYQGAGDTFYLDGIDAFNSAKYTAAEGSTETLAEITSSWLKLTLVKDGTYTLSDTAGYNMTESGTWTYAGYQLSVTPNSK